MATKINPEYLGNIVILLHKGFKVPDIARALDKPQSSVRNTIRCYGLKAKK